MISFAIKTEIKLMMMPVSHTCDVDIRLSNHDGYNDDCNADDFDDDGGKREEAQQTIWQFSRLDCR